MSSSSKSWILPNQFQKLNDIRDIDLICDFVYDKAESFRELVNQILPSLKSSDSSQFQQQVNQMLLYAADSTVLTFHSLILSGLALTPLSKTFVEAFGELFSSFFEFKPLTADIVSLRRLNRKMAKQFDMFIDLVENPTRESIEPSEFNTAKNQLYANLSTVSVQIARFSALPSNQGVARADVIETLQSEMQNLSKSVAAIRSKAVGKASTELGSLLTKLKEATDNNALNQEINLALSASACLGIAKVTQVLSDRIVIEADPQAAGEIPSTFSLPSSVAKAASITDGFDEVELARRHLENAIKTFKTSLESPLALSRELLQSLKDFTGVCSVLVEKSMGMSQIVTDNRAQVELQTQIHAFGNSVNGVQMAVKARLLRSPNFNSDMEDALRRLTANLNNVLNSAREATKVKSEENDNLDDVSRELLATSKAIEDMSNRLAQFAAKADISVEAESEFDLSAYTAESGTLASFLIQNAQPVLKATQRILIRAREITADLIKQLGKIDNEAGIIRCAQDLSESAELLIICAEILLNEDDPDAEFKVIAASKIIKGSVASLVAQVLVKGGDSQGIMNEHVRTVSKLTDTIISSVEKIVEEKLAQEELKKPRKKVANPMIMKLNMQNEVNAARKQLQDDEKALYDFRRTRGYK